MGLLSMTLQILIPPASEPVSLSEAKTAVRVTDTVEDALISRLISAARQKIERALGLGLIAASYQETFDRWGPRRLKSGAIRLRMGPLLSVTAIRVADSSGGFLVIDPGLYSARLATRPGLIAPTAAGLPEAGIGSGGLQVDYRCGFGDSAADVPEPLRQAILALVAHGFENRDEAKAPIGLVEPWLAPYRRVRL
jgi:uncharacterized phiE125 gp8 family phage protein